MSKSNILHILPTYSTPEVLIDLNKGYVMVEGKSVPEDSVTFYNNILDFLKQERTLTFNRLEANFDLEYFNSNSSKFILDIMLTISSLKNNQNDLKIYINWLVEETDEDMIEAGEDYQAIIKTNFNIVFKEEE